LFRPPPPPPPLLSLFSSPPPAAAATLLCRHPPIVHVFATVATTAIAGGFTLLVTPNLHLARCMMFAVHAGIRIPTFGAQLQNHNQIQLKIQHVPFFLKNSIFPACCFPPPPQHPHTPRGHVKHRTTASTRRFILNHDQFRIRTTTSSP
jgi:hypothetical protein